MARIQRLPDGGGRARLVFACAAPLAVGALLLELFGPAGGPIDAALVKVPSGLGSGTFLSGGLSFAAVTTAHVFACLAALMLAADLLRRTPGSAPFARNGIALAVAVTILLPLLTRYVPGNASHLTYGVFDAFFRQSGTAAGFVTPILGGPTPLDLAIFLPTALGVAAVAMVAAAANAQLLLFEGIMASRGSRQVARIRQLHGRLKRCLYALGVVLVTSTVAASLFFHLPSRLPAKKDSEAAALLGRMADYAAELSIFWGLIYSLTLAIAVGLPIVLLQSRLRRALEPPFPPHTPETSREMLAKAGILSDGAEQLKFLSTLVAPLAAAPVASFIQSAVRF